MQNPLPMSRTIARKNSTQQTADATERERKKQPRVEHEGRGGGELQRSATAVVGR
jgi:hypothetical protein